MRRKGGGVMGWFRDGAPGHEGYLVGLVEHETAVSRTVWRELGRSWGDETDRRIERFQVACECGWRSRVFHTPKYGVQKPAEWYPYIVELHDSEIEDEAGRLWGRHVDEELTHGLPRRLSRLAVRP